MTTQVLYKNSKFFLGFTQCVVVASFLALSFGTLPAWSQATINNGVYDNGAINGNLNTMSNQIQSVPASNPGNTMNNQVCDSSGICNNGGNMSGNQNYNGNNNSNSAQTQTQVYSPTQALSTGGTSALVLPRNPLALPNANLGRSNFGLQFGLNNNPILGNLNSVNGKTDAMSWFLQGGLTIPFGKIPDIIANPRNNQLDDIRQQRMMDEREVFGSLQNQQNAKANVQGKVVRLNAYNYATTASPKLEGVRDGLRQVESEKATLLNSPKVLALADAEVFSKPLGKGDKVGTTTTGEEYRYIGHTNSGWVKIIMSNGREGWVKGQFEYLKNDYTEIDTVTLGNPTDDLKNAQSPLRGKLAVSASSARKQ